MKNSAIFFCDEKALNNIIKYKVDDLFGLNQRLLIAPTYIVKNYPKIKNVKKFKSSWSKKDIQIFTDYFYLKNFFNRNNGSLNLYLRTRFFGPYKIKNLKTFMLIFFSMFKFIRTINWYFIFENRQSTPSEFIKSMKSKKIIAADDTALFTKYLRDEKIRFVITVATFKNPQVNDFLQACKMLSIPSVALPDCWDNIVTAPTLPEEISHLLVWSRQQKNHVTKFYPYLAKNTEIIGSYRIKTNKQGKAKLKLLKKPKIFLLYLEGYIYEDLNHAIDKIVGCIVDSFSGTVMFREIFIRIRHYPWPRQKEAASSPVFRTRIENNLKIIIESSFHKTLSEDLKGVDLVISELTTAGLEISFKHKPVFFIGSKKSPRYLDTVKGYSFEFANELHKHLPVINLSKNNDLKALQFHFTKIINQSSISSYKRSQLYFGEPLNRKKLKDILKNYELN